MLLGTLLFQTFYFWLVTLVFTNVHPASLKKSERLSGAMTVWYFPMISISESAIEEIVFRAMPLALAVQYKPNRLVEIVVVSLNEGVGGMSGKIVKPTLATVTVHVAMNMLGLYLR